MTDLSWFPHTPARWRQRTAGLSALAKAAYLELRDHAWESGTRGLPPCVLPDDDKKLAGMSGLGPLWRRVAAEVRGLFVVTDDGLLDRPLFELWEKQQELYKRRQEAGKKGGNAKANAQQTPSNATAKAPRGSSTREREGSLPLQGKKNPANGDAPAPDGARSAIADDGEHRRREVFARIGQRPDEPRNSNTEGESVRDILDRVLAAGA